MDSTARLGPYEIKGFLTDVGLEDLYLGSDTRHETEVVIRPLSVFVNEEEVVEHLRAQALRIKALGEPGLLHLSTIRKADGAVLAIAHRPDGRALDHFIPTEGLLSRDVFDLSLALTEAIVKLHGAELMHGYLYAGRVIVSDERDLRVLVIGPEEAERQRPLRAAACTAPEIWNGDPLDEQAEVFALGVLLHQIATGELPFTGDNSEEMAESIQHDLTAPITDARPDLPRELAMIVARCLKKDRELRYGTSKEVLQDLADLKQAVLEGKVKIGRRAAADAKAGVASDDDDAADVDDDSAATANGRAVPLAHSARGAGIDWRLPAAAAVVLLLGMLLGYLLRGGGTAPQAAPPPTLTRATAAGGPELFPQLSPDGALLYYARAENHDWGIYSQRVGDNEAVELTSDSPAGDSQPSLSPDGARIAFRSERDGGGIFLMDVGGRNVRRLSDSGYNPSWSPDGERLLVASVPVYEVPYLGMSSEIVAIDVAGGGETPIPGANGMQPAYSPSGERIAYWSARGSNASDILTIPAGGGEALAVTAHSSVNWSPAWSPSGDYLYWVSDRAGSMDIWRVAIDQSSGETRGDAEPVTMGGSTRALHPSFARDTGTLAYSEAVAERHIYRIPFDASSGTVGGPPALVPGLDRGGLAPDLSGDGHIVFVRRQGDSEQVWVASGDGGDATALTDQKVRAYGARLSPDGQRVAYLSDQSGSLQLWTVPTGGGAARRLTDLTTRKVSLPVWSRDGNGIVMSVGGAMLPSYTLLFDAARSPEAQVAQTLLSTPSERTFEPHSFSRDGTLIAGSIRDGSGRLNGIAVLQRGDEQYRRVADFGMYPVWMRDGRRLLFQWGNALYLLDTRDPEPRFVFSSVPDALGPVFALSGDERWIYVSLERSEADVWLLQR